MLKPQAHAGQINNPHQASPQVIQTSKGRRAEEGWGTCWKSDTPQCSLSQSGRDEDSSSAALSVLLLNMISCYDMVPGDVGHALIRRFHPGPVGPWMSSSHRANIDVACQSLPNNVNGDWKACFSSKRKSNLHKLINLNVLFNKISHSLKGFPESSKGIISLVCLVRWLHFCS